MQLGGDAQVVLLIERVKVGDERLSGGAALNGLQDGSLDLHVAVILHVAAEGGDDRGALAEGLANVLVHDKVDIALTITGLLVGEAVKLLGKRANRLGKQFGRTGGNGELAALGADHNAGRLDDIAQVELLQDLPGSFLDIVHAAEQLDVSGGVAKDQEHDLALAALGDDTAAHGDGLGALFLVCQAGIALKQVGGMVGDVGMLGIGILTGGVQRGAIGEAAGALVIQRRSVLCCRIDGLVLSHVLSFYNKTLPEA